MQAANENNQTQITDYYSILVRIQSLTNKDKKLSAMLQNLSSQEADVEELNFEVHHIKCWKEFIAASKVSQTPEILKSFAFHF